jgi:hypothetical protein
LVLQALRTVNDLCQGQGRNSACYGNYLVHAQLAADQPQSVFDAPADIASLNHLTSIETAPLNEELSEWGVSILSLQANIPGALPGQSALFMLLGGAEIESAIAPEAAFVAAQPPASLSAIADSVLRDRPAEDAPIARSVMPGDSLLADARSGEYLRVTAGEQFGWIRTDQTSAAADALNVLPEFTQGESFTPMQAFYLRTSIGEPVCAQAPSALVVQGPEGLRVDIQANGADINLGSTIILRTYTVDEAERAGLYLFNGLDVGGLLELSVIDGRVIVRQEDGTPVTIQTGEQAFICLDKPDDLGVDGRDNDQPITYACGGWTIPSRIPETLRDEFSLVDDYPLLYPVDILTPTPTMPPSATQTSGPGATSTPAGTPPATRVAGQPNLTVNARMSLTQATSAALPVIGPANAAGQRWLLDAQLTLSNGGSAPATGVLVRGVMPQSGAASAQVSQGSYVAETDSWQVGAIPARGQANLRLFGLLDAACGETLNGVLRVTQQSGPAVNVAYAVTADCPPQATASPTPSLIPSNTPSPSPTPSLTPSLTPSVTATATASNTPTNTPVPPTLTPTSAPVLRVGPVLECVRDNGGGSFTAFFGYNNLSGAVQSIPVGGANRFSPSPENRGQPTSFQPGRHANVFSVTWNGDNLVWSLNLNGQGGTSTANRNSTRCAGQQPTASNTPLPPTNTPTSTPVPPTNTPTQTPSNTPVPPTNTPTQTPSNTPVPPTATPSNTPVPPTSTPTPSNTPVPPTATPSNTPVPPTTAPTATDDPDGPKLTICHNGQSTITIPVHTVYRVHLFPDNTPRPGNEGTYLGPCVR